VYKLHQKRAKEREAAKSIVAERGGATVTRDWGNEARLAEHQSEAEKRGSNATTVSSTGPHVTVAKATHVPKTKQSKEPHLQQGSLRQPGHNNAINLSSVDLSRPPGPGHLPRPDAQRASNHSAKVHKHAQNEKAGSRKASPSRSQLFKIYTEKQSPSSGSRPTAVAIKVPGKAQTKNDQGLTNGVYVPRNAALGLAKTATQGVQERDRLTRKLSRVLISSSEVNKEPAIATPQNARQNVSVQESRSSVKATPSSDDSTRRYKDGNQNSSVDIVKTGSIDRGLDREDKVSDATQLRSASVKAEETLLLSNEWLERKQDQRRTLRRRISSMILPSRALRDEDAYLPLKEPVAKPAMSRRRSMLLMFG
jgi:hypothetical protein